MTKQRFYDEDLAYVHHTGFGDFARSAGPQLLRLLRRGGVRGGTLVDLGCGSGIWAALASQQGFDVMGIDQSAAMLRIARRVAPRARFLHSSLHDAQLPPCDAVTALGEGLNYLCPGDRPANRLERLFRRLAQALRPGGWLMFDVMVRAGEPLSSRGWRAEQDWAVLFEANEQPRRRLLTRRSIVFRKIGRLWRRTEETHRVQLYTQKEVLQALRRANFTARAGPAYGTYALLPHRLAFLARRKPDRAS